MVYNNFLRLLSQRLTRCLLCGDTADGFGLCTPCSAELPWLHSACRHCALPLPPQQEEARICPGCLKAPPSFSEARAAWHYAFPVSQLVHHFKYRGDLACGHSLAQLAAVYMRPQAPPDLLIPVPLHWRRYLSRGFNQAQLIAAEFGRRWRIPVNPRALRKAAAGGAQQQLKRSQRLRNLARGFIVRAPVEGLHIGLVDDVITTGATLEAAARALLAAGAARVSAYALARTP